jgi:hypothetical protein
VTDRPIIFSGAMVRALLDGRKTQTRRLATAPLRRVEVGDRLYVREAWSGLFWNPEDIDGRAREFWETPKLERTADLSSGLFYRLDEEAKPIGLRFIPEGEWTPSIHMPRWASRLTLTVEDVRFQRLTAIAGHDARCEGVERLDDAGAWRDYSGRFAETLTAVESFASLWDSLHTKEGERWQDSPEIVALTFRVERGNIDRVEGAR